MFRFRFSNLSFITKSFYPTSNRLLIPFYYNHNYYCTLKQNDKSSFNNKHNNNNNNTSSDNILLSNNGKLITRSVGVLLLGTVIWYIYYNLKKNIPSNDVAEVSVKTEGEIDIGAPFTLVDHNGNIKNSKIDFAGKFMLIYFGFTFCPDICPTELTKMADVMNILETLDKDEYVTPIMITVDPYRDTVEQINSYVKEFHPKLIGLTGNPETIKQVAKDFKIYNFVPENAGEEDYLVDHSVFTFLMGPKGGYLDFFGPDKTEHEITLQVLKRIQDYEDEINPPSITEKIKRKYENLKNKYTK